MTDFDRKLIQKAQGLRIWDYDDVAALAKVADTPEAATQLWSIRREYMDLIHETC